jgi:hypothetical protein
MSWTQAVCNPCWDARNPDRQPMKMNEGHRETEKCCWCGKPTRSGIYQRIDPATVPYPAV